MSDPPTIDQVTADVPRLGRAVTAHLAAAAAAVDAANANTQAQLTLAAASKELSDSQRVLEADIDALVAAS
jgi:hypothetical protein